MTPPIYLVLIIAYSHGILQGVVVDNADPKATLKECTDFVQQLETKALAQDDVTLVMKCFPVPSTSP